MRFNTVFFDLDGTLTDSGLGITNSVLYALEQAGMPLPPRGELYQFIGPPLMEAFQAVYGVSPEQSRQMLASFRVYFEKTGLFENEPYAGIAQALERLRGAGLRLAVATSKPEPFAVQILEHFALSAYFERIVGSDMDETRTAKDQVIAHALTCMDGLDPARTLMVGDRSHDILGGKRNGLTTMGVLYGYGSREELCGAGADLLAETTAQLADLILRA